MKKIWLLVILIISTLCRGTLVDGMVLLGILYYGTSNSSVDMQAYRHGRVQVQPTDHCKYFIRFNSASI